MNIRVDLQQNMYGPSFHKGPSKDSADFGVLLTSYRAALDHI